MRRGRFHTVVLTSFPRTTREEGIEEATRPASSRWGWARLLKRVFALDLEPCPRCHPGTVRLIVAITSWPIIRRLLRHLKLALTPRRWHWRA